MTYAMKTPTTLIKATALGLFAIGLAFSNAQAQGYQFKSADSVQVKVGHSANMPRVKPDEFRVQHRPNPSYDDSYVDGPVYVRVRVVNSEPVYVAVSVPEEKRTCYRTKEPVYINQQIGSSDPNKIVTGAIIGGILGNVATQKDKKAQPLATIVGAVAGASIADSQHKSVKTLSHYGYKNVCETKVVYREETRFSHYDVTYLYRGYHTVRMRNEPGEWITVVDDEHHY